MSNATILHETVTGYTVYNADKLDYVRDVRESIKVFKVFRTAYAAAQRLSGSAVIRIHVRMEEDPRRCGACDQLLIPVNTREWLRCSRCGE